MTGGHLSDESEHLLIELYPSLLRFASVVGGFEVEPTDLVHEAVLRTLRAHPDLEVNDPAAYLRHTIVNLARKQGNRRARWARVAHRLAPDRSEPTFFPSDLADLMQLTPSVRAVLYLTVIEGLTHAEAAAVVGCSESAARARSSRGLRALRSVLTEETTHDNHS